MLTAWIGELRRGVHAGRRSCPRPSRGPLGRSAVRPSWPRVVRIGDDAEVGTVVSRSPSGTTPPVIADGRARPTLHNFAGSVPETRQYYLRPCAYYAAIVPATR